MLKHSLLCKRWRERNREKTREAARRYYQRHRNECLSYRKRWHEDNKERALAKQKEYAEVNKEEIKAYRRKWDKGEKGRQIRKAASHRRRLNGASYISAEIVRLVEQRNLEIFEVLSCEYCGRAVKGNYHLDHRIPLSRGGNNSFDNFSISCSKCNLSKGQKTVEEFGGLKPCLVEF